MKVVAYARYSTDNQTENSIAYQLDAIQRYCNSHNMPQITNIYIDEAQSGTNTERNGLKRMLADAEEHKFDAIVIYDQSRLSRNIIDWFSIREKLRSLGISLHSCTDPIDDIDNPSAFLSEGMKAIINQHYVMETRKKTIAGQTARAKQGKFCGGTPPLGYDIIDGKYVINQYEAEAVKLIFDLYASGKSYDNIIDVLKSKGYKSKRNAAIGINALYSILRNERYIGVYSWNKRQVKRFRKWAGGKPNPNVVIMEDAIPAIIDLYTWKAVQKRMEKNKINKENKSRRNREYILSGLLRCAKCGGAFVGFTNVSSKGYETKYYTCANKRRLHNCDAKNINGSELEMLVTMVIKDEILNGDMIERTADAIINAYKPNSGNVEGIKKEIAECDRKIKNLLQALADGLRSTSVNEALSELEIKKAALQERLKTIDNTGKAISREKLIEKLRRDAENLKSDSASMKEIVRQYISKVEIADDTVTICAIGDLNTSGCGGAQYDVFKFTFNRLTVFGHLHIRKNTI